MFLVEQNHYAVGCVADCQDEEWQLLNLQMSTYQLHFKPLTFSHVYPYYTLTFCHSLCFVFIFYFWAYIEQLLCMKFGINKPDTLCFALPCLAW